MNIVMVEALVEHLWHFLGGGCGEHMILPWVVAVWTGGLVLARSWWTRGDTGEVGGGE